MRINKIRITLVCRYPLANQAVHDRPESEFNCKMLIYVEVEWIQTSNPDIYRDIAPHVQEGAELNESSEETAYGRLVTYNVWVNLYRESTIAGTSEQNTILYRETLQFS